jgi:hypothetical protein
MSAKPTPKLPVPKPEPLGLTLLTALTAVLSSLLLGLVLVSPALAFSDSNAELRESAEARKASAASAAPQQLAVARPAATRPLPH